MRVRRLLQWLSALFFICLAVVIFLLATESGLTLSLHLVSKLIPGQLQLHDSHGNLLQGFSAKSLRYSDQSQKIHAENLVLHWHPLSLFSGQVNIDKFSLDNIRVMTTTSLPIANIDNFYAHSEITHAVWHLQGRWQQLSWQVNDKMKLDSPHGELIVHKQQQNYNFWLGSRIIGTNLPTGYWSIQGDANHQQMNLRKVQGNILTGLIQGNAQIQWQTTPHWSCQLNIKNINPGIVWPMLAGKIHARFNASGDDHSSQWTLDHLAGNFHQQPLGGQAQLVIDNDNFIFKAIDLHAGENRLKLQGNLNLAQISTLSWAINIPDFNQFISHGYGQFSSRGQWKNTTTFTQLTTDTQANNFGLGADYITHLQSHIDLDLRDKGKTEWKIAVNNANYQGHYLEKLDSTLSGTTQQHQLAIDAQQDNHQLTLTLLGKLVEKNWRGQLTKIRIHSPRVGVWQNKQASNIQIAPQQHNISPICLYQNDSKLCTQANLHDKQHWSLKLEAQHIPAYYLHAYLLADHWLYTHADINLIADNNNGQLQAQAKMTLSPGYLNYQQQSHPQKVQLLAGSFLSTINHKGFNSQFTLSLEKKQHINATLNFPDYTVKDLSLNSTMMTGNVNIAISQLGLLLPLLPQAKDVQGDLKIHSTISGTLKHPQLQGDVALAIKHLLIPRLGISLHNTSAHAQGDANGKITFDAQAKLDKGKLSLTGNSQNIANKFTTTFSLQGDNALIANTSEYKIYISPNLHIKQEDQSLNINGTLHIPSATLKPRVFNNRTITLPSDVSIKRSDIVKENALKLSNNIKVSLGDNIIIDTLGLQGKLRGALQLRQNSQSITTADGALKIADGKYQAYGQDLTIDQGQLLFTGGAIENPGINVKAIRRIKTTTSNNSNQLQNLADINKTRIVLPNENGDLTVGVSVQGRIRDPKITLFSEPVSFSQSDILSYLLLGRSLSGANQNDAQTLFRAASALNIGTKDLSSLNQQLQQNFGLDELSIQTSAVASDSDTLDANGDNPLLQNTTLTLGKALSSRLYINYTVGLLQPMNVLKMRYLLGSKWSLQTETSDNSNGLDVF